MAGAIPFRSIYTASLVTEEGITGVVAVNEPYELRLCSYQGERWKELGVSCISKHLYEYLDHIAVVLPSQQITSTSNGSQVVPDGSHMSTLQVAFLHLPTVDRQAPSHQQVCEGVAWILDEGQSGKGTVYVHCKAGRARSATLVAAYLIEVAAFTCSGRGLPCISSTRLFQVEGLGVEEAVEAVRQARPHIKLYKKHYEVLRRFHSDKQIKSKS